MYFFPSKSSLRVSIYTETLSLHLLCHQRTRSHSEHTGDLLLISPILHPLSSFLLPHLATCPDNVSVVCFPASNKRVRRRHPRSLRPAPCSKKKKPFSKSIDALFICEASCPRELVCINTSWGLMKASGGLRTPSFSVL